MTGSYRRPPTLRLVMLPFGSDSATEWRDAVRMTGRSGRGVQPRVPDRPRRGRAGLPLVVSGCRDAQRNAGFPHRDSVSIECVYETESVFYGAPPTPPPLPPSEGSCSLPLVRGSAGSRQPGRLTARALRRLADAGEPPDLVLTDVRMPPANKDDGLRAALDIRVAHPTQPIVVLSVHRRYIRPRATHPSRRGNWLPPQNRVNRVRDFTS